MSFWFKKFGRLPKGNTLKRIMQSTNYKNGQFINLDTYCSNTTQSKFKLFKTVIKLLSGPNVNIPSIKTNLLDLNKSEDVLIWFGHSSYFIQIAGYKFLIDPVFSEVSSPVPFFPRAFPGANIYKTKEIPEIDYLIITHDHWDHLDYKTIMQLRFKHIICPLGVGSYFKYWGLDNIIEMDWNNDVILNKVSIYCLPSKHFSGRLFARNKTLWASFLIKTSKNYKIFIGGDGGYDSRFRTFQEKFDNVDLAILESGQYNENWLEIHMFPEETIKAAEDLQARFLLPVHNSKFRLSTHDWNEPFEKLTTLSQGKNFKLLTPMIGERLDLEKIDTQIFQKWR